MSVNLLAEGHEDLARRFAAKRATQADDRFGNTEWRTAVTGAPLFVGALAALDCRITDIMPLDTHSILVGVVEDIHFGPRGKPLVHFEGGYTSLLSALSETLS
jgi:flavin reductase (DIM6/NTAB) family NADH-FMN oxidoreductase RutF